MSAVLFGEDLVTLIKYDNQNRFGIKEPTLPLFWLYGATMDGAVTTATASSANMPKIVDSIQEMAAIKVELSFFLQYLSAW